MSSLTLDIGDYILYLTKGQYFLVLAVFLEANQESAPWIEWWSLKVDHLMLGLLW